MLEEYSPTVDYILSVVELGYAHIQEGANQAYIKVPNMLNHAEPAELVYIVTIGILAVFAAIFLIKMVVRIVHATFWAAFVIGILVYPLRWLISQYNA